MPTDFCHLARAARVSPPNLVVSFPGEPAPLAETAKPWLLRYSCSAFTSSPVEPVCRSRLKLAFTLALATALALGAGLPLRTASCTRSAFNCVVSWAINAVLCPVVKLALSVAAGVGVVTAGATYAPPPPPPPLPEEEPAPLPVDTDVVVLPVAFPLHVLEEGVIVIDPVLIDDKSLSVDAVALQVSVTM